MLKHLLAAAAITVVPLALVGCSDDNSTFEVTTTVVSHETTQDIWVWAPDAEGSWPIIYALHGTDGTGDGLAATASSLASHGYVVFSPTWRSGMDAECSYRYALTVADQYGGDPDLGIIGIGHSLGASGILIGGLDDAAYAAGGTYDACFTGGPRPSVLVPIAGCHYEYQGDTFGFDPVPFSGRDVDITLIVGDEDTVCELWQSQDATEELNNVGYDARLVEVDGGNHANVVFSEIVDDEWVTVPDDPVGEEVVEIILDAIDASQNASDTPSTTTTPGPAWTEKDLTFVVGPNQLHGILTMPASGASHPAVVMPFNSTGTGGELATGVSSRYQTELAHALAEIGYAAFRYDPPGIGKSTGEVTIQSLQSRADETIAALHLVQDHPMIQASQVGLWGISQEAWVISIAAADHPDDVAFIIPVSGAGISVAEQQVWGVEAQSRAAGLEPDDVERATVIMRLLVDWQLTNPIYQDVNQQAVDHLGNGPWNDLLALAYQPDPISPSDELTAVIEILTSIKDEPWAAALHIDTVYLPALLSIPPDQIETVQIAAERTLLLDPGDHLTRVTSPVLAFFGEDDIVQPTDRSAELFADYLDTAGNDDVTIVILPDVGHEIVLSTPGHWDPMVQWLDNHL